MLPRLRNGGTSLKFMLRNPMTVVMLVRKTGCALMRRLSVIASRLLLPRRISWIIDTRTWIESATASVMIMVIEAVEGGVRDSPAQPARPSPLVTERPITETVAKVPETDRKSTAMTRMMTTYISGVSVAMSFIADS